MSKSKYNTIKTKTKGDEAVKRIVDGKDRFLDCYNDLFSYLEGLSKDLEEMDISVIAKNLETICSITLDFIAAYSYVNTKYSIYNEHYDELQNTIERQNSIIDEQSDMIKQLSEINNKQKDMINRLSELNDERSKLISRYINIIDGYEESLNERLLIIEQQNNLIKKLQNDLDTINR